MTKDGDLYCWGYNRQGQVGNGTTEAQLTPVQVLSDVVSAAVCDSNEYCCTAITGSQTRQNFSNKMKRGDFKESELRRIAEALGCELKISFIDKVSGEEF